MVAIGRRAYTDNLGLETVGIATDDRGRIEVDTHLQTNVPGIYAIGDVIKGAMLAHKAEEEGVFVAETLAGQQPHIHYHLIPGVVYTWPEVAAVGSTWSAVISLTPRAGELRSAPSGPDDRDRVAGKRALAPGVRVRRERALK